jgi:hypothetical protein
LEHGGVIDDQVCAHLQLYVPPEGMHTTCDRLYHVDTNHRMV